MPQKNNNVRFVRIRGKIVPIKSNKSRHQVVDRVRLKRGQTDIDMSPRKKKTSKVRSALFAGAGAGIGIAGFLSRGSISRKIGSSISSIAEGAKGLAGKAASSATGRRITKFAKRKERRTQLNIVKRKRKVASRKRGLIKTLGKLENRELLKAGSRGGKFGLAAGIAGGFAAGPFGFAILGGAAGAAVTSQRIARSKLSKFPSRFGSFGPTARALRG